MSSIATRTGDDGATGLLHGLRVPKTDPRIEAIGAIDELSACLACATARFGEGEPLIRKVIAGLQESLVSVMAELATPENQLPATPTSPRSRLDPAALDEADRLITALEAGGIRFEDWNAPRFTDGAATLDLARTICRRAERRVWAVEDGFRTSRPLVPRYLNRLSDLLWLLARKGSAL